MPVPIKPNNSVSGYSSILRDIDISVLLNNPNTLSASMVKEALATDIDADLLFKVWSKSSVIKNASNIEDKIYRLSNDIDKSSVLQLKASGLIRGDDSHIMFTSKAASVIKTFVLSEQNQFLRKSVKKPYSIILAEQKAPKRKSGLALANTLVLSSVPNVSIPGKNGYGQKSRPESDQVYVWNRRLIKREGVSNKEYSVRVYTDENGRYEVWAFNGRANRTQIAQPKGSYSTRSSAYSVAEQIINDKRSGGYVPASTFYGINEVNQSIPGIPLGSTPKTTTQERPSGTQNRSPSTPTSAPSPTPSTPKNERVTPEVPKKTPEDLVEKIEKGLKKIIMDVDIDDVLRKMEEQE